MAKKKVKKGKKAPAKAKKKTVSKVSGQKSEVEIYSEKKGKEPAKFDITIKRQKLGEAPKEYHFVLNDGKKLKSIKELADVMEEMGEDVFKHHVSEFKNDFANWVNDVFDEKKLAEELRAINSKIETELKLLRHVVKKIK